MKHEDLPVRSEGDKTHDSNLQGLARMLAFSAHAAPRDRNLSSTFVEDAVPARPTMRAHGRMSVPAPARVVQTLRDALTTQVGS